MLARATEIDLVRTGNRRGVRTGAAADVGRRKSQAREGRKADALARTWIVLRDVVAVDGAPAYDLFLVLEGPDVFRPVTTSQRHRCAASLEPPVAISKPDDKEPDRKEALAFDVSEALAKLSKVRGFACRTCASRSCGGR